MSHISESLGNGMSRANHTVSSTVSVLLTVENAQIQLLSLSFRTKQRSVLQIATAQLMLAEVTAMNCFVLTKQVVEC